MISTLVFFFLVNFLRRSLDFKDKTVVFNILGIDSAGPYRYRSLLSSYLRDADFAMFLYDISSRVGKLIIRNILFS